METVKERKSYYPTSSKAKNAWNERNYDRLAVVLPKGRKEDWKRNAQSEGKSMNQFIIAAVEEHLREKGIS